MSKINIILLISLGLGGSANGQDDRQRFLADYTRHSSALRTAFNNVVGSYHTTFYNNGGKPNVLQKVTFKSNFFNILIEGSTFDLSDAGVEKRFSSATEVSNLRYSFSLTRGSIGGQRVLSQFMRRSDDERPRFFTLSFPFADPRFGGRSYLDLAAAPDSQVVGYREGLVKGRPTRAVTVVFLCPGFGTGAMSLRRLELHFDPERRWVCVAKKLLDPTPPHGLRYDEVYEYVVDAGGWPTPKRVEACDYSKRSQTGQLHCAIDILEYNRVFAPLDDRQFTMSAFGLPEPEGLDDSDLPAIATDALAPKDELPNSSYRPPLWLGFTALAIVVGLTAYLGFRRRVRPKPLTFPGRAEPLPAPPKE